MLRTAVLGTTPEAFLGERAGGCGTLHSRSVLVDTFGFAKLVPGNDGLLTQVLKAGYNLENRSFTMASRSSITMICHGDRRTDGRERAQPLEEDLLLAPLLLWSNRSSYISST